MSKKHMLIMLACCLVPVIAIGAVTIFHVPVSQVVIYGIVLLCPLGHLLMMRGMMHGESHDHEQPHDHAQMLDASSSPLIKERAEK